MNTEKLMTKEPIACNAFDTLNDAARLMWEHNVGCLPVVDDASRVIGVVTDRDICMGAYTQGKRLREMRVVHSMSSKPCTVAPTDSARDAARVMHENQIHRVPVVDDEHRLVGVVSLSDLARSANAEQGPRNRRAHRASVARTLGAFSHLPEAPRIPDISSAN